MVRISELRIRNFRSFGAGLKDVGHLISFPGPVSFLVGENNVGKSNVLSALKECVLYAMGGRPSMNDYHRKDPRAQVSMGGKFEFDGADYEMMEKMFAVKLDTPRTVVHSALRMLFPSCDASSIHSTRDSSVAWHFNGRIAFKTYLSPDTAAGHVDPTSAVPLDTFIGHCRSLPEAKNADEILRKAGHDPSRTAINLNQDVSSVMGNVIIPRLGVFDEIRFRPKGIGQSILQSFDGSRVADVLHTLKNGGKEQREMFTQIQRVFWETFPDLKLEVTGQTQSPQITVEQVATGIEVEIDRSGAGIGQVVTLLANMVNARGMIFAIDTPESNLHPHGLRSLLSFFNHVAKSNQLILATHSPLVIPPDRLESVAAVRLFRGKSSIYQMSPKTLTDTEKEKLRHLLGPEARELMFSRKVIFVEGDTELGALPILFKAISRNLDTEGISLVPMDGKHFAKFVKIARAFGIPFSVVTDRDTLVNIETGVSGPEGRIACSVLVSQLYELGLMSYRQVKSVGVLARSGAKGAQPHSYPSQVLQKLLVIARKHRVFVWPSDFDAMLGSFLSPRTVEEIARQTKGKVVRGRALASALVENKPFPPDLERVLSRLTRMRNRGER